MLSVGFSQESLFSHPILSPVFFFHVLKLRFGTQEPWEVACWAGKPRVGAAACGEDAEQMGLKAELVWMCPVLLALRKGDTLPTVPPFACSFP